MTIIGPFNREDWVFMKDLKEDISFMTKKDASRFEVAIRKERILLKDLLTREAA